MNQTADDLRAGAQYIRVYGHTKKTAEDADGSVCAVGSLACAINAHVGICYGEMAGITTEKWNRFEAAVLALHNYLEATGVLAKYSTVTFWNDAPDRTMDDVVTGMEKAAAWYEEQA